MNGQSNQNPQESPVSSGSFWSRHSRLLVRLIIIAVIIVVAIIYSQTQNPDDTRVGMEDGEEIEETMEGEGLPVEDSVAGEEITVTKGDKKNTEVTVTEKEPEQTVTVTGEEITVSAARGDGYTHLARRALAEYLDKTGSQELQVEHKIYIEDYLQKNISEKQPLNPGDSASFSQGDIQVAIDAALALTDNQVKNLSQYVPLVPSLN